METFLERTRGERGRHSHRFAHGFRLWLGPSYLSDSAEIQIPRIVEASGLSEEEVREIIDRNTEGKTLGVFGEDKVNVLLVNIEIAQAMGLIPASSEE